MIFQIGKLCNLRKNSGEYYLVQVFHASLIFETIVRGRREEKGATGEGSLQVKAFISIRCLQAQDSMKIHTC